MKKYTKKIAVFLSLVLALQMILQVTTPVCAQENQVSACGDQAAAYQVITEEDYYPEDYIGYRYPVRPGTAEWAELSDHQAMVDACEIPEDVLSGMTSEELAQTVLAYPLLVDMYAYDDVHKGLDIVTEHFNGLIEFSERDDSATALVELYVTQESTDIASLDGVIINTVDSEYSLGVDHSVCSSMFRSMVIHTLLTDDTYTEKMTAADVALLNSTTPQETELDKGTLYLTEETGEASTTASFTYICEVGGYPVITDEDPISIIGGGVTLYTTAWESYWLCSDGEVRCRGTTSDMTSAYKTVLSDQYYNVYGIRPVAAATVKYNCHSYAWYWQNTANTYWINDPSAYFVTRGRRTAQNAAVNNKIVYYESSDGSYQSLTHSGVVIGIAGSTSGRIFTIKSKWGSSGLYEHRLENCPYYYSDEGVPLDYIFYST